MRDLLHDDKRYKVEAYQFIREALQYAHEHVLESSDTSAGDQGPRHITGQQLCEACQFYAIDQAYYSKWCLRIGVFTPPVTSGKSFTT